MPKTAKWQEQMQSVVGAKGFTSADDDMAPWLTDWRGRYTGAAVAMVSPATTQETADILKIANENAISVVPQGGNSGMVGGATPDADGQSILLSLRRMNQIRTIAPEDQLVVCEAAKVPRRSADWFPQRLAVPRCCATERCARWWLALRAYYQTAASSTDWPRSKRTIAAMI